MKKTLTMKSAAFLLTGAMLFSSVPALAGEASTDYTPWVNSNILGEVTGEEAVRLQDDFYQAVNAPWLSTVQFKPGYPSAGSFVARTDEITDQLLLMMTDKTLTSHDAALLQNIYEMFLDWETRDALGTSQLTEHVDAIRAIETLDDLTAYLISEEGLYNGNALWAIGIGNDFADSSWYSLEIGSIALSLGDSAEYTDRTANGDAVKTAYDQQMICLLGKVGYTEEEAREIIALSYAFEEKLAPYTLTVLEQSSPDVIDRIYNPITFEELKERCTAYPLPQILEAFDSADWERMNLEEPDWLDAMNALYTEENVPGMRAYTLLQYLGSFSSLLDEETFREMQRISRERLGIDDSDTDEKLAYSAASDLLPDCISRVYIEKYVTSETKEEITAIIQEIIDTYRVMLSEEDWLSEETRAQAVNKLDHIRINAAYPEKWEDMSSLNFAGAEDGGSLIDAVEAISEYSLSLFRKRKNTQVDPEIWDFGVTDVNAYYNPLDNSINIIAGILGAPFYTPDMSMEEKLGGIGTVIGHEISHAFDTTGAQFDADGNYVSWWSLEDYSAFTERAQKLIDYYNQIVPIPGMSYSGDMVQGEAIADMGGMKCMLRIAQETENFDYEAFFRSFATVWQSVYTPEVEQLLIAQDPHPLDYLRVNVTSMQFPEFYETFDVQPGDGMYLAPEDRINVW